MKVHLCVPTYNNEKTIEATLESLIAQTYKNFSISIVDNKSTDKTLDLIRPFLKNNNINIIENSINIGAEKNFEKCLSMAKDDLFAIFHADDLYHPDCLEKIVGFFSRKNDISAIAFNANIIDSSGKIEGVRFVPREIEKDTLTLLESENLYGLVLKYGNFITCPGVVFKTTFVRKNITQWKGQLFKTSADLDIWMTTAKLGKLFFYNHALMNYRESSVSLSYQMARTRVHRHDLFLVLDYYANFYKKTFWNQHYYNFLIAKDYVFTSVTRMRKGHVSSGAETCDKINWASVLLCSFTSLWHLKFSLYIYLFPFYSALKKIKFKL